VLGSTLTWTSLVVQPGPSAVLRLTMDEHQLRMRALSEGEAEARSRYLLYLKHLMTSHAGENRPGGEAQGDQLEVLKGWLEEDGTSEAQFYFRSLKNRLISSGVLLMDPGLGLTEAPAYEEWRRESSQWVE
jgi:hypothetical protein